MRHTLARKVLLALVLGGTALLGGCYYTPYPAYYAGGYPAYYAPPPVYGAVVVGAPYYRGRYWR